MRLRYFILVFFNVCFLFQPSSYAYNYHQPIEKYKLQNGLTVILEEDHSLPLVNIQLWVRAGSCYEGRFLGSGITHLVEHMVFKGETTGASLRIAKRMQEMGGELDASTSKEYTYFDVTVKKEYLVETMKLVRDIIINAEFIDSELEKEKDVIIHEMNLIENDPARFLSDSFFRLAFQGHPFGEPIIGYRDLFRNITREDLIEYYRSSYIPSNMILILAGDFSSASVKPDIEDLWSNNPRVFSEKKYIPQKPSLVGPLAQVICKKILSAYMLTGFYSPPVDSEDAYAMDVLAEIAGGAESSRLVKKIRDKLGLVSGISSFNYTAACTGICGVSANLIGNNWGLILKSVLKEMYKFRSEFVTNKELLSAKKRIIHGYTSLLETINGRTYDLGTSEIYTGNPLYYRTYISGIKKVSKEDIKRCAQKYFNRQYLSTVALMPENLSEPKTKIIPAEKKSEILKIKLDNGLSILMKEDNRLPLVIVRLAGLGGLLEEEMPGLSYFFSKIWMREREDLVKKIELEGGTIGSFSGNNSYGCGIEVFSEDVRLALDVLKELIQGFSAGGKNIELIRNMQLAQIMQEEDTPYGYAFNLAKRTFFEDHPYKNSILGTKESVSKIDKQALIGFFEKHLKSGDLTISIFGDINKNELAELVKEKFGAIARMPIEKAPDIPSVLPRVSTKEEERKIEQTIIVLSYPGVNIYSEDRYAMELVEQIFSGQAGRLYESIREKQAMSYSIGALNFVGMQNGSFMFYISTDSDNKKNAVEQLFSEVDRIKNEGVTGEELQRTKKYYLTQIQKEWQSCSNLSMQITMNELYGLGLDYHKKYLEEIEKVNIEDIKITANKYFRNDWYSLIVAGRLVEGEAESPKSN